MNRAHRLPELVRSEFELRSAEGLPIRGVVERPARARALVVLLHGFKGFRRWGFFPWLCERLQLAGAATCSFDFSRNGVGEDGESFDRLDLFRDDTYSAQLSDISSVLGHLKQQQELDPLPISLFGYSRGGAVALLAAAAAPRLQSVVTWSAIATLDRWDEQTLRDWRASGFIDVPNSRTGQMMRLSTAMLDDYEKHRVEYDPLRAARALHVPHLVVHGKNDETVEVGDAHQLVAQNRLSSILLVPQGSHTFGAIHPLVHVPDALLLAARVTSKFILGY